MCVWCVWCVFRSFITVCWFASNRKVEITEEDEKMFDQVRFFSSKVVEKELALALTKQDEKYGFVRCLAFVSLIVFSANYPTTQSPPGSVINLSLLRSKMNHNVSLLSSFSLPLLSSFSLLISSTHL